MLRSFLILLAAIPVVASAQPDIVGPHRQSGPRVGFTVLSPGVIDEMNDAIERGRIGAPVDGGFPVISQIGWQFEFQTFQAETGLTGMTELVPMLSGLERGLVIPNMTWLVGLRSPGGLEAGIGPNLILSGRFREVTEEAYNELGPIAVQARVGLAMVAGINMRTQGMSVPLNAAVVVGEHGPRLSLLVGLNVSNARY